MQSIGDAVSDDPRLGGIGQERKKEINDRFSYAECKAFVKDLFPQKTTWGLKVYYCLSKTLWNWLIMEIVSVNRKSSHFMFTI